MSLVKLEAYRIEPDVWLPESAIHSIVQVKDGASWELYYYVVKYGPADDPIEMKVAEISKKTIVPNTAGYKVTYIVGFNYDDEPECEVTEYTPSGLVIEE